MKIGYIRVSTQEQNTMRQEVLMERLGVEQVFIDKVSGKNMNRPELRTMLDFVRKGDVVIVESISRFARNTKDLLELVEQLTAKGVEFVSQKEVYADHLRGRSRAGERIHPPASERRNCRRKGTRSVQRQVPCRAART